MNFSISSQWIHRYLTQACFCPWLLGTLIQTDTNTNIKHCACTELILSGETLGKSQQLRWAQPSKTLQKEDRRTGGHALQCNGPEREEQTPWSWCNEEHEEWKWGNEGAEPSAGGMTGHVPGLALPCMPLICFSLLSQDKSRYKPHSWNFYNEILGLTPQLQGKLSNI